MSERMNASPERRLEDLDAILANRAHIWGTTKYGPCLILRQPRGYMIELKGPGHGVETEIRIGSNGTIENLGSKKLSHLKTSHGQSKLTQDERLPTAHIDIDELIASFRETSHAHPKKPMGNQPQIR